MALYTVTGGAGFIGSHLVEELLRRGHRVRIADDFSTGKRANIEAVRDVVVGASARMDIVEGDLASLEVARAAADGADYVLHQAAIPSVPRSVKDPISSNRANIDGTLNMLVAARDAGVKRLVFAGSSSEYGDTPTLPKHEDMAPDPLSPYALQKLVGELYLRQFTRLYGLETVSIRYFNVISLAIKWLLEGTRPTIHGDGEQTRDFTYVANVVDGVLRAAEAPGIAGESINVATAGRISLNTLLREVQAILGTELEPIYGPPREGDVRDSQASIAKAERLLGYRPIVPFDEGLRRTVEWFRTAQP